MKKPIISLFILLSSLTINAMEQISASIQPEVPVEPSLQLTQRTHNASDFGFYYNLSKELDLLCKSGLYLLLNSEHMFLETLTRSAFEGRLGTVNLLLNNEDPKSKNTLKAKCLALGSAIRGNVYRNNLLTIQALIEKGTFITNPVKELLASRPSRTINQYLATLKLNPTIKDIFNCMNENNTHYLTALKHNSLIHSVATSPDGTYLATASYDKTVLIYDLKQKQVVDTIRHNGWINSIVFSPDSTYLATASDDKTVQIYDLQQKLVVDTIHHSGWINSVTFSPDSTCIATASRDKTAIVYDLKQKQAIDTIRHESGITSVAFSPNNIYLAITSHDKTTQIYNLKEQKPIKIIPHNDCAHLAAFSPNGIHFASASYDKTTQIYNLKEQKTTKIKHNSDISLIAFSLDGTYLVTALDKTVQIYDLEQKKVIDTISHSGSVTSVAFSPDNIYLATASDDKTVQVYDLAQLKKVTTIQHKNRVCSVTFLPHGNHLVTASSDKAQIWDWQEWHADITQEINNLDSQHITLLNSLDQLIKNAIKEAPEITNEVAHTLPPLIKTNIENQIKLAK